MIKPLPNHLLKDLEKVKESLIVLWWWQHGSTNGNTVPDWVKQHPDWPKNCQKKHNFENGGSTMLSLTGQLTKKIAPFIKQLEDSREDT